MKTAGYCLITIALLFGVQFLMYQVQTDSNNYMDTEKWISVLNWIKGIAGFQTLLLFIAGYSMISLETRLSNIEFDVNTNQEKLNKIGNKDA